MNPPVRSLRYPNIALTSLKQGSNFLDMVKRLSRVQIIPAPKIEDRITRVVQALNGIYRGEPNNGRYDARLLLLLVKRFQVFIQAWENDPASFFEDREDWSGFSDLASETFGPIMRILKRYQVSPSMEFALPAEVEQRSPAKYYLGMSWDVLGKQRNKHHEFRLVLDIMEIAQAGRISVLTQCAHCHKWLFKRFAHQRFCSDECKELFHRTNEADKKRRREWAKQNYWIHKNKNVK